MKNHIAFTLQFCLFLSFLCLPILGCSSDSSGGDEVLIPKNLNTSIAKMGSSDMLPNGDGSGMITLTVTAENATLYKINFGNGQVVESTSGLVNHTYSMSGTNTYTIFVSAYNGTQFISQTLTTTVFVTQDLLWSEEFDVDGPPNSTKWGYDLGNNGWGNNEIQNYTNRPENAIVQNGVLKIKTIKENYGGSEYTSARLKSQGKFSFKFGRVDIRAKLPAGGGTWPALWMLGENITTVSWPACGEIDIMEHLGNEPNKIHGSLHSPSNYGGNSNSGTTTISNATTEFHIYSVDWSETYIRFYVDNVLYYSFVNNSNTPFNTNFFFILNNAMGGWGGTVDPNFISSTFEIDYIRVYQ